MKDTKNKIKLSSEKDFKKSGLKDFMDRFKKLQGDPNYIAMGMAVGVFVSLTPTIPFHTVIALSLAFILKGSKPAAAVGVWFSNPVTIPVFYYGSYKVGMFMLGKSIPFNAKYESVSELMKLGLDVTIAMIAGGMILGIIPGIATYFITRKIFNTIRVRRKMEGNSIDTV